MFGCIRLRNSLFLTQMAQLIFLDHHQNHILTTSHHLSDFCIAVTCGQIKKMQLHGPFSVNQVGLQVKCYPARKQSLPLVRTVISTFRYDTTKHCGFIIHANSPLLGTIKTKCQDPAIVHQTLCLPKKNNNFHLNLICVEISEIRCTRKTAEAVLCLPKPIYYSFYLQ